MWRVEASVDKRAEILDETRFMGDAPYDTVRALAQYMDLLRIRDGVRLFKEGSAARYMSLIVEGKVRIQKQTLDEDTRVLVVVGRGQVIGEMSVIDGQPRSAEGVAEGETTLLMLSQKRYNELVDEKPRVAVQVLTQIARLLSHRLRSTSGQLVEHLD